MKKISARRFSNKAITSLFCVLSLFLAVVSFASCNLEILEEEKAGAPQVNSSKSGIAITIPKYTSTTQYINIYRRDVTGKAKNKRNNLPYEKIGIVNPSRFSDKNCFYEDIYVYKNHTYQYCVRYSSEKTKVESFWSDDISPKSTAGLEESESYLYSPSELIYDEANKAVYFSKNFTIQETLKDFNPRIVISNSSKVEIFDIPTSIISGKTIIGGSSSTFSLLGLLPADFLSTDKNLVNLTILGIIGEKINYSADDKESTQTEALSKTWTPLTATVLKDKDGKTISTINVFSTTGLSGDDWSDL